MKRWFAALAACCLALSFVPVAAAEGIGGQPNPDAVPIMAIEPRFAHAFPFSEGLAAVVVEDKIGFINRNGAFAIQPTFDGRQAASMENGLYQFREGRAMIREYGKYGFIDKQGTVIIEAKYDKAYPFQEGLAAVVTGDRLGYIDINGTLVIPQIYYYNPQLTENPSFQNGLAKVAKKTGSTVHYGFIDAKGKEAIPLKEWSVEPFSDGLALISDNSGDRREIYFVDTKGTKILSLDGRYSRAYSFYSGLARVEKGGKIGYIDKNGREVVAPSYTYALNFSENRAIAKIGADYVLIDPSGKESGRLSYSYIEKFSNGLAMVERTTLSLVDGRMVRESKTGYIDENGNEAITPQFEKGQGFSEGLAAVRVDGLWGFIAKPDTELPSAWAKEEMAQVAALGLIPPEMDGGYREPVSRADFARLAIHVAAAAKGKSVDDLLKEKGKTIDKTAFRDTRDETVLAAHALGIISGRGQGVFDPEGRITRQEAAVMLAQLAALLGVVPDKAPPVFADADQIAPWAMEAAKTVSAITDPENGAAVISGTGKNRFSPQGTYEKQQAFITLKRMYQACMALSGN